MDAPLDTDADRVTRTAMASGSSFELFAGVIGIAVAIAGLAGSHPLIMAAIGTIAVSFALIAQGSTVAARWKKAVHIVGEERTDVFGISTELVGGLVGLVLGVAALFYLTPERVLPAAVIVLGVTLLVGGPTQPDIAEVASSASRKSWQVTRDAVRTSSSVMVIAGLAAIVLGILAGVAAAPVLILSLVALLCVGAALVISGGALFARFAHRFS